MRHDTIAAIASALGESAVNVIRLSGPDVFDLVNPLFKGPNLHKVVPNTIHYGFIVDGDKPIDEVLISVFHAPKSFTAENTIEIHCHGGPYIANKIMSLFIAKGARQAERGEFTERAFLNGRIDLTQAESVLDMIEARSSLSLDLANKGLRGDIHRAITDLRDTLLSLIATIEVNIDYPEYDDVEQLNASLIQPRAHTLLTTIQRILSRAEDGRIIRDGVKTAIIGRPNVGKSSLLNVLLKEDRAIVTDIHGTTRDTIEGTANIGGLSLHLIDTAGIRESQDIIEQIGIKRAKKVIEEAELVLFVLNNNEPLTDDDKQLLTLTKNKKRIVIINKIDLESKIGVEFNDSVAISALTKHGIDLLEKRIKAMFFSGEIDLDEHTYLSNTRQIGAMKQAQAALMDALETAKTAMPIDMIAVDLKAAYDALGEIIGETSDTALLDTLFSKFCLGK